MICYRLVFILHLLGGALEWHLKSTRKEFLKVQCDGDKRSVLDCWVDTTQRNDCLHEIAVLCFGKLLGYAIKRGGGGSSTPSALAQIIFFEKFYAIKMQHTFLQKVHNLATLSFGSFCYNFGNSMPN